MRIFTRNTKVIGVTKAELADLQALCQKAMKGEKAEIQVGPSQFMAIEVSDQHRFMSSGEREHMRRHPEER